MVGPPVSEVVISQPQIEREPMGYLPVVLNECSRIKPAQDLVQVAGQGAIGYLHGGAVL